MPPASLFLEVADAAAASSNFVDLTGDGGVLKRTLFPGTGAAPPADAVALLHLQSAVHPGGAPLHCSLDTAGWYRLDLRSASDGNSPLRGVHEPYDLIELHYFSFVPKRPPRRKVLRILFLGD